MNKAIWIWAMILLVVAVGWTAEKTVVLKVKVQLANVRSEPDVLAGVISQVKLGTLLESAGKVDSFYEVTVTDKDGKSVFGFIHASVVDVIAGAEEREKEPAIPVQRTEPVIEREPTRPPAYYPRQGGRFLLLGNYVLSNLAFSETIPPEISKSSRTGFGGAIGYEFGSSIFRIELDAMVLPRGAVLEGTSGADKVKTTISGYGLGAGILAKIRFLPGSSPFVLGGADAGYILSPKEIHEVNETTTEVDTSNDINRLYYGLEFGGGYELEMSGLALVFEARYCLGLTNQIKNPLNNESIKSRALVFMVGVKL
jgi:Outer membrane protein beta-barrel domain